LVFLDRRSSADSTSRTTRPSCHGQHLPCIEKQNLLPSLNSPIKSKVLRRDRCDRRVSAEAPSETAPPPPVGPDLPRPRPVPLGGCVAVLLIFHDDVDDNFLGSSIGVNKLRVVVNSYHRLVWKIS
jgi:hypothetical protein